MMIGRITLVESLVFSPHLARARLEDGPRSAGAACCLQGRGAPCDHAHTAGAHDVVTTMRMYAAITLVTMRMQHGTTT